jgi:D-alanyl-D-alanine carboxypeptidase/D-alanyl-D-alanine-endopeptidase (penicillin-binding protein 4)
VLALTLLPGEAQARQPDPGQPTRASAQALPVSTAAANARIARKIPKRLHAKALGKHVSVKVADLQAGRQIFTKAPNKPKLPASNMKLVTAVTAMSTIGLDTRLPTTVVGEGKAGRKVVLVGGGDPVLTSTQLRTLATRTAKALVTKLTATPPATDPPVTEPPVTDPPAPPTSPKAVKLKVFFDDSLFSPPSLAPGWPASYVPYVVRPVRPLVRDGRGGSDTATDAGRYFADKVRAKVAKRVAADDDLAVTVRFKGRTTAADDATEIARFAGNHLSSALSWMLLVSDNNIAEMLYRLSAVKSGRPGTWQGGAKTAMATMASLGVRTAGLVLADGSGVSRSDRLTSSALVQLLRRAADPAHPELNALRSMLPVSGVSGTLKASNGRYTTGKSRCARGAISAKTGTLHDTIALSGYTTGADGRDKVFSVLVNQRPERRYSPLSTRRAVDVIAATVNGCA